MDEVERSVEEKLAAAYAEIERLRREHEELLVDIAYGRVEVRPRGWAGVPLQPYLLIRRDERERGATQHGDSV